MDRSSGESISMPVTGRCTLVLAIAAGVACGPSETSDEAIARSIDLSRVASFGCVDCAGPQQFGEIMDTGISATGQVWVLTQYPPFVRRFSIEDPNDVLSFGDEGQGPGEMQLPGWLFPRSDGSLFVLAVGPRGLLTRFSSTGEYLDSRVLGSRIMTEVDYDSLGEQLFYVSWSPIDDVPWVSRWRVGEDEPAVLLRDPSVFPLAVTGKPNSYAPFVARPGGGFAIGDGVTSYSVTLFDDEGKAVGRVSRDLEPQPKSEAEMARDTAAAEAVRRRMGFTPPISAMRRFFKGGALRFDDRGRLWIQRDTGEADETLFDVFSPAGELHAEVRLPLRLVSAPAFDIDGDYLIGVVEDELANQSVLVWRITNR